MSSPASSPEPDPTPYQRVTDAMPHIVWAHDNSGVPIYVNEKWSEYTGLDLAETLRMGGSALIHPDDRADAVQRSLEARRHGTAYESTYRLRGRDGAYRWHHSRVAPVRDGERVALWVGTAVDIDEQRRVHDEQRFLVEATKVLGASLDIDETVNDVARLVVPHIADWCSVDLLDDAGKLARLAVAHVDPSKVSLAWRLWQLLPPRPEDPHGPYAVMQSGRAQLIEEIPDELLVQSIADPELLAVCRSLGLRSAMSVPLMVRDRAIGCLALVSAESGRRYGSRDLAFAEELARRIAIAVDNARLFGEMKQARAVAEAMTSDVVEQSRAVQAALLEMRAQRDAALARLQALERAAAAPGTS